MYLMYLKLPSPPEAPSRLTSQEVYVPEPTVLVGDKNINSPLVSSYESISHSWKLFTSYTIMIDCAVV